MAVATLAMVEIPALASGMRSAEVSVPKMVSVAGREDMKKGIRMGPSTPGGPKWICAMVALPVRLDQESL